MKTPSPRPAGHVLSSPSRDPRGAGLAPVPGASPVPFDPDPHLTHCVIAAALACLAAVCLRPSPFWALNVTRPFVLARIPVRPDRFRQTVD